jgi:hypothetical protein
LELVFFLKSPNFGVEDRGPTGVTTTVDSSVSRRLPLFSSLHCRSNGCRRCACTLVPSTAALMPPPSSLCARPPTSSRQQPWICSGFEGFKLLGILHLIICPALPWRRQATKDNSRSGASRSKTNSEQAASSANFFNTSALVLCSFLSN